MYGGYLKTEAVTEAGTTGKDIPVLRRAGLILIALGMLEIAYGLITAPPNTIKLNLFGLITGSLLYFGGLRVASGVKWLACLALVPALGAVLQPFVVAPIDLTLTSIRLGPLQMLMLYLPMLYMLGVVIFLVVELNREEYFAARAAAGRKLRDMRIPLAIGAVIAVGVTVMQFRVLYGDDAARATQMVSARLGPSYQYYANSIVYQYGEKSLVHATVQAWNDNEVHLIPVRWEK